MELKKYRVPINLLVLGESPEDAWDYVQTALDHSDILDQDGIFGVDDMTDLEDIEEQEE